MANPNALPKIILLLVIAAIVNSCQFQQRAYEKDGEYIGTLSVSGAFALYPITVRWAEGFTKMHPKVRIDISAGGAGKGMTDVLTGMVDLAMFSREITDVEIRKGAFEIAVAKDAVLPTTSANNPYLPILKEQGLSRDAFKQLFIDGNIKYWGELLGTKGLEKINVYTRSDACGAAEVWANYMGGNQESLKGLGVFGDPGIADAVRVDKYGVGYNNLIFAYDINSGKLYDGLDIIPIDLNGNGIIEPEEDFYGSMQEVMEAISNGTFPAPPARPLYFISKGKPTNPVVVAFLKYILTQGQGIVHEAGYVNLPKELEEAELLRIK
jgi:phosphate transport system substrate-binding protein